MVNDIKKSADGLALQVTRKARDVAGLVRENSDGETTHLSDVHVFGFDGLLLVVGTGVSPADRAELVATAAGDTGTLHEGARASLATSGHGYQVHLPGCESAGFSEGDTGHVRATDRVLYIHDGTHGRLIDDLMTVRGQT